MESRKRCAVLVAAAGGLCAVSTAYAQVTWTNGAGDGDWHNDGNWSSGEQPKPEDSVVIPQGFEGVASLGAFVRELSAQSPLYVAGGGTYSVLGATLSQFETTGMFLTDGEAVFRGPTSVQTSSSWRAALGFRNVGEFNVRSMPLFQTTFTNEGTLRVEDGPIYVGGTAVLDNNGTLELRSGGHLYSGGRVNNSGTWRKVGAGDSEVGCSIRHEGSLSVEDGLLRLLGGGDYYAPITVELGGTVRLEGPFVEGAHYFSGTNVSGGGELEIQCGNAGVRVLLDSTISMQGDDGMHMQSGEVYIGPFLSLRNDGKLRWDGGWFEGGGELTNGGTMLVPAARGVSARGVIIRNLGLADIKGFITLSEFAHFQNESNLDLSGELRAPNPFVGTVVNNGTMRAVPAPGGAAKITAGFLQTFGTTTVASGTLNLLGGGILEGGSMTSAGSGQTTLLAFDSGTFLVPGSVQIDARADGEVRMRGAGTVVNVGGELALGGGGWIFLESNAQLGGAGAVLNGGTFAWNSQIGVSGQALFGNVGLVLIPSGGARLRGQFTNLPGPGVLQQGSLDMATSTAANGAKWVLQPATAAQIGISGAGGLFYNNDGTLSAEAPPGAGHGANITATLDNQGTVQAIGGITLTVGGQLVQLQNGELNGGTWLTAEGGRIILPGNPPIRRLRNVTVDGSQQGMPWLSGVDDLEASDLVANGDVVFTRPVRAYSGDNLGDRKPVVRIGPGAEVTVPEQTTIGEPADSTIAYIEEATVLASPLDPPRLITPVLVVHGGVRPGGADAAGPFNLTGELSMQPGGIVEIEVGGPAPEAEHDVVTVTGRADLAGALDVRLLNGFVPEPGDRLTILTASDGIGGQFGSLDVPDGFGVEYLGDRVDLVYGDCAADLDGNGILNVFDFLAFQTAFGNQDSEGDFDGNGLFNVFDFLAFQTAYGTGC